LSFTDSIRRNELSLLLPTLLAGPILRRVDSIRRNELSLLLPTLLAGPILRRVDPKQICIWITSSRPIVLRAEIFRAADLMNTIKYTNRNKQVHPIGVGSVKSIRLGERLYISLVIARPIPRHEGSNCSADIKKDFFFPTDELLAYDIELCYNDLNDQGENIKKSERLQDLGLLNGENSIIYELKNSENIDDGISLPTFFLRRKNNLPLNILYGSCHKLHGEGDDCFAIADEIISSSLKDLNKRPSLLFLTGDNIYADSVADPLFQYLTTFSVKLLGWEEQFYGVNKKLSQIPAGERREFVKQHAKFTSDDARNHLISFGEFATMYLLAWNNQIWPHSFIHEIDSIYNKDNKKNFDKAVKRLERARIVLSAIRRVLANVPTYMMFDDHDITDDWNITKEWHESVKTSDCGKQIITNGLVAFWAFQAWGNDPSLYNDEFIDRITNYLDKNGNVDVKEQSSFEDYFWNYHGWTFCAPTNPLTILIDNRT
jgi:hypothetical protein